MEQVPNMQRKLAVKSGCHTCSRTRSFALFCAFSPKWYEIKSFIFNALYCSLAVVFFFLFLLLCVRATATAISFVFEIPKSVYLSFSLQKKSQTQQICATLSICHFQRHNLSSARLKGIQWKTIDKIRRSTKTSADFGHFGGIVLFVVVVFVMAY